MLLLVFFAGKAVSHKETLWYFEISNTEQGIMKIEVVGIKPLHFRLKYFL